MEKQDVEKLNQSQKEQQRLLGQAVDYLKEIKNQYPDLRQENLELEVCPLQINVAQGLNKLTGRQTKAEHDRLLGVFSSYRGNGQDLLGCKFKILIGNKPVISPDFVEFFLIEKTGYIPIKDAAFPLNEPINSTDVTVEFENALAATGYTVYFYFITRKKG